VYRDQDLLVRSKAQESDETYYLWAMRFFMQFNRLVGFQVALIRFSFVIRKQQFD